MPEIQDIAAPRDEGEARIEGAGRALTETRRIRGPRAARIFQISLNA